MTPLLTATPSVPPTYNVGMAETFSWIPVDGAGRPLYAQAVYLVNGGVGGGGGGGGVSSTVDITTPGTANTLLNTIVGKLNQQLGLNGFDFIEPGAVRTGSWTTITVATSTARFSVVGATGSTGLPNMTNYDFPITFTMSGPFTSIGLINGAVIAYK
jgi:hypothetical protein